MFFSSKGSSCFILFAHQHLFKASFYRGYIFFCVQYFCHIKHDLECKTAFFLGFDRLKSFYRLSEHLEIVQSCSPLMHLYLSHKSYFLQFIKQISKWKDDYCNVTNVISDCIVKCVIFACNLKSACICISRCNQRMELFFINDMPFGMVPFILKLDEQ